MTLEDQYINTPVPAHVGGDNCEVSILHNSSEFSCGIKLQEATVVAGLIMSPPFPCIPHSYPCFLHPSNELLVLESLSQDVFVGKLNLRLLQ